MLEVAYITSGRYHILLQNVVEVVAYKEERKLIFVDHAIAWLNLGIDILHKLQVSLPESLQKCNRKVDNSFLIDAWGAVSQDQDMPP